MRESKFVEQNKEKWAGFEKDLKDKKRDPNLLRNHLVQITDDLSYSRTFYKNRSVRIYLNSLGQLVYNNIYKNKKNFGKSVNVFFKEEVPKIIYFCRREMLISFLVLLLSIGIGAFSSAKDENFARSILGDSYVDMTQENIKKGDPFGVYKDSGPFEMFVYIAMNNLRVSLIVFIFGLLASYGALVIMVRNGIMLGVFMYFFYSRNLAAEFNLTVWMHGTIEILTLVVETVAGMLLGRGMVYPGTLSRIKAFSIWGKRGAMVFLSTVPFILFAAFIESFLTRYTEMPNILRLILILTSLAVMVYYFVWYPYKKFRNSEDVDLGMPDIKPETTIDFKADIIYSNGNIFLKTIQLFGIHFSRIAKFTLGFSILYVLLLAIFNLSDGIRAFKVLEIDFGEFILRLITNGYSKFFEMYGNLSLLFNTDENIKMYVLSSLWIAGILVIALYVFCRQFVSYKFNPGRVILFGLLCSFAINLLMLSGSGWMVSAYILVSPMVVIIFTNLSLGLNTGNVFEIFFNSLKSSFGRILGVIFLFLMISFFGMIFIISPVSYIAVYLLEMNVELSAETYTLLLQLTMVFAFTLLLTFCMIFHCVQCMYLGFTVNEITRADGLMTGIEQIGKSKKAYGIETE